MLRLRDVPPRSHSQTARSLATPPLSLCSIRHLYSARGLRSRSAPNTTPVTTVAEHPDTKPFVAEHAVDEHPVAEHPVAEHQVAKHPVANDPVARHGTRPLRNLIPQVTPDMYAFDESFTIQEIYHHNQRLAQRDLTLQRVRNMQEWLKAIGLGLENSLPDLQHKLSTARLKTNHEVFKITCGFFRDIGKSCGDVEIRWQGLVDGERWADRQDEWLRNVYGEHLAAADAKLSGEVEIFSKAQRAIQEEDRQEHVEVMMQILEGVYGFYPNDEGKASAKEQEQTSQEHRQVVMPINAGGHVLSTDGTIKMPFKKKKMKGKKTVSLGDAVAASPNKRTDQIQDSMETTKATLSRSVKNCEHDSVREQSTLSAEGNSETTKADSKSNEDAVSQPEAQRERRDTLTDELVQGAEETAETTKANSESKKNIVNEKRVAGDRRDTLADTLEDVLNEATDELIVGRDHDHGTTPDQRIPEAPETSQDRGDTPTKRAAQLGDEGALQSNNTQDGQQSIVADHSNDTVSDKRSSRDSHDTFVDELAHTDRETADGHNAGSSQTQNSIAEFECSGDAGEKNAGTVTVDPEDVHQTSDSTEPGLYTPSQSSISVVDTQRQPAELWGRHEDTESFLSRVDQASSNYDERCARELWEWPNDLLYFPKFTDPNSIKYDEERTIKLWGRRTADVERLVPMESGSSWINTSGGVPGTVLESTV